MVAQTPAADETDKTLTKGGIMAMLGLRLVTGLTCLAISIVFISPATAVPKLTPGSKRYCACTCATQDAILFTPSWAKRYDCGLANNKKCRREKDGAVGRLHSCMECEMTDNGMFCVNPGLASGATPGVPPGKLERIMPRGIEGTTEIEPPPLESDEKEK